MSGRRRLDSLCNCDSPTTWHHLHTADCRYIAAVDKLQFRNGIAVNIDELIAAADSEVSR